MLLQKWKSIAIPNRISASNRRDWRCQIVELEINYWFMTGLSEVIIGAVLEDRIMNIQDRRVFDRPCFSNSSLLIFEFVTFVEFFSCCFIIIRMRRNWSCVRRYRFRGHARYQQIFGHVSPFVIAFAFFSFFPHIVQSGSQFNISLIPLL